jgi:hypothetical protein
MSRDCHAIQECLVELSGDVHQLTDAEQQHLTTCTECQSIAEAERELHQLLSEAIPLRDDELVEQIIGGLPSPGRWRRALAFMPVAVSFLVVSAGALLVGGLPGSSLLPHLATYSAQGWASLIQSLLDWSVVLLTLAQAFQVELTSVPKIAGLIAFAGVLGIAAASLRHRKTRRWQETG